MQDGKYLKAIKAEMNRRSSEEWYTKNYKNVE
jgi:hypothetical protein